MTPAELEALDAAAGLPSEAPRALRSLYGASDRQKASNTVKSMAGPGERPQEIFTPLALLAPLWSVWGEIALDPCGHPDAPVSQIAREVWTARDVREPGGRRPVWEGRGLTDPWYHYTYVNPPFAELERWMVYAAQAWRGDLAVLAPVRSHRKWWRNFACWCVPIYLNPVKFEGYDQAFPAPLALHVAGSSRAAVIEAYADAGFGEVL